MTTDTTITIKTKPKHHPLRIFFAISIQMTVFGVGILAGSSAMQWFGFFILSLLLLAAVVSLTNGHTGLTIREAKELIDQIEKDQIQ